MASATSHDSMAKPQRSLSPPPSAQATRYRHKKKKKADPFEELALTPVSSRPSSPENLPGEEESLLTKIILTPILFISFIISLFLVNHRNRARRSKAHTTYSSSILSHLAPSSWLDPEPYQDPTDSTWGREGDPGHVEPHDAIGPPKDAAGQGQKNKAKKRKSWHLNKKIRKVAKMEISDAFEMRGRVMVLMLFVIVLASIAMWTISKWIYVSIINLLISARS
ncbi:hypothetical protein J1614_011880 [Plenodomus biglobosus]|nr:hypothetical protein J1614_011880 [Plenodomus biglobosus]